MFIYPTGVKGYKVWLINERKCVVSRNVIFYENATCKTNLQDIQDPSKTDTV